MKTSILYRFGGSPPPFGGVGAVLNGFGLEKTANLFKTGYRPLLVAYRRKKGGLDPPFGWFLPPTEDVTLGGQKVDFNLFVTPF